MGRYAAKALMGRALEKASLAVPFRLPLWETRRSETRERERERRRAAAKGRDTDEQRRSGGELLRAAICAEGAGETALPPSPQGHPQLGRSPSPVLPRRTVSSSPFLICF